VLAKLCDDEGLFEAAGAAMARASTPGSARTRRLVVAVLALWASVQVLGS